MSQAVAWSFVAAAGTALGAAGVFAIRQPSSKLLNFSTAFAAGVMLGASFLSLLPAAFLDLDPAVAALLLALGVLTVAVLDRRIPHFHGRQADLSGWQHQHPDLPTEVVEEHTRWKLPRKTYLLASALTVHNIPEAMAVGAGLATGDPVFGVALALAIAIHNIPEGFAVVAPALGHRERGKLFWLATATGLVEVPAIILTYLLASQVSGIIAPALAFAAGAMIYVAFDELLPDTYREEPAKVTAAIATGVITFMFVLSLVGLAS
ncbi:MAG: ZIP family metal transporter [Solirubrobacterales bacterium]